MLNLIIKAGTKVPSYYDTYLRRGTWFGTMVNLLNPNGWNTMASNSFRLPEIKPDSFWQFADKSSSAQSELIESVLAQDAYLGIHFYSFHNTQLQMLLLEGPDQGHSTGGGKYEKIEEEITTSWLYNVCSTDVLQVRPFVEKSYFLGKLSNFSSPKFCT